MTERLLTIEKVVEQISFSPTWIRQQIREGKFPKPIAFGVLCRWSEAEVNAWVEEQKAREREPRPMPQALRKPA